MSARVFLDWKRPFLPAVSAWLVQHRREGDRLDLSTTEILCASRRAARRLLELLADAADANDLLFDPPELLTASAWLDRHRAGDRPLASDLQCRLAWRQSIHALSEIQRDALAMSPRASEAWITRLVDLRADLGWGAKGFGDTLAYARETGLGEEQIERWEALFALESEYLELLDRAAVVDAPHPGEFEPSPGGCELITAGLAELPAATRGAVEGWVNRTHLIQAPAELADEFDELGLPLLEAWCARPLSLSEEQIFVAREPTQSALWAVDRIAALSCTAADSPAAEDFTVSILDRESDPAFVEALEECHLATHDARGLPARQQPLPRLLRRIAALIRDDSVVALRELMRLSEIEHRLRQPDESAATPLYTLDEFQRKHLQHAAGLLDATDASGPLLPYKAQLRASLGDLLGPSRTLGEWQAPLLDCLREFLADEDYDSSHLGGRHQIQMFDAMTEFLQSWSQLPAALDPKLDAATALTLLSEDLERRSLALVPEAASIELVGWLDMVHDDAPHALLLGLNEGMLPENDAIDPLLTQSLRCALDLRHDRARLARDSFWLECIVQSRRSCSLFLASRSLSNDPLRPSRLLFRCADEMIPARVTHVFHPREPLLPPDEETIAKDSGAIARPPILDDLLKPLAAMSVSSFSDYLACPYRFTLRHRLRLRDEAPADAHELDGARFGSLLHEVLENFGRSEAKDEADAKQIARALMRELDGLAARRFGPHVIATVGLQIESAHERLRKFAVWQAARRADGWKMCAVELKFERQSSSLDVDDEPMPLRGRLDRVDVHEDGRLAILDYKTSNALTNVRTAHGPKKDGSWHDLQLPLYDHLYRQKHGLDGVAAIELAYCNLGRDSVEYSEAKWTRDELDDALECAREIVREIRRGKLPPPRPEAARRFPELSPICRDAILSSDEDGEGADE
jgi:RecB family exonuclease